MDMVIPLRGDLTWKRKLYDITQRIVQLTSESTNVHKVISVGLAVCNRVCDLSHILVSHRLHVSNNCGAGKHILNVPHLAG